ncbi:MAG: phosphate acyltransferase PlsX [Alphaproteobacteria bacterium]|nr:phosphate acyltransferase PlsX [Alphaproteobacteria bacterium]
MAENPLFISVDAMGGDYSPRIVVEGVAIAAKKYPDMRFLLFGDFEQVAAELKKFPHLKNVCEIRHSPEMVHNEDKPSQVIRNKNTSMYQAIDAVRNGEAQAVVSAGNTGALMAISKMLLKTIQKIHRPAIVSMMPHRYGKYVMLDLGANSECSAVNLAEFAVMGNVLAKHALNIETPRVALLNIGSEEMKGREEIRHAAQMLKEASNDLNLNFIGYIEPHDIPFGKADVIVADGFTGNVALKSIEGTAKFAAALLKDSVKKAPISWIGLPFLYFAAKRIKKIMNPKLYNGAMFVGLNGLSVKSHGGADGFSFSVALGNAALLVRQNFVATIKEELEDIDLEEISQDMFYDVL